MENLFFMRVFFKPETHVGEAVENLTRRREVESSIERYCLRARDATDKGSL